MSSSNFQAAKIALYIKRNNDFVRIYRSSEALSPFGARMSNNDFIDFTSEPYMNHVLEGERFRSYFYEHSEIKNLFIHVMTPELKNISPTSLNIIGHYISHPTY